MRRSLHRTLPIGLIVLAAACSSQSTPVRLQGDPGSIASLAGTWAGQYWGAGSSRGGALTFTLRSGSDSLYGDVTMLDVAGQPVVAADQGDVHRTHVSSPQQLRIDFVAVKGDSIRGTLEPYTSPDCSCVVGATFVGQVRSGEIKGTYETRNAGRVHGQGRWEMKRTGGA
jgi:hypothetical protein